MRIAGLSVASIAAVAAAIIVLGALGAWLTDLSPWYYNLRKPAIQPPDKLFGPAWSLIFAFMGSALVIAWNSASATSTQRLVLLCAAGANFLLNLCWSLLFFRKRRPDLALLEVGVFWLSIAAMMVAVRPMSTTAMWLLLPYLLWVSFASLLNQRVVALNGPFPHS